MFTDIESGAKPAFLACSKHVAFFLVQPNVQPPFHSICFLPEYNNWKAQKNNPLIVDGNIEMSGVHFYRQLQSRAHTQCAV